MLKFKLSFQKPKANKEEHQQEEQPNQKLSKVSYFHVILIAKHITEQGNVLKRSKIGLAVLYRATSGKNSGFSGHIWQNRGFLV